MAGQADIKIKVTSDVKGGQQGLKDLDTQVGKTEAGMGKMGVAAVGGAAALIALGTKSVLAFQDLGLTVGKFSDATGISAESSSKLIEVAGDVGISAETLQGSIGKMEKSLGTNAEAFAAYGVEVARTKDGQIDANETFINAVDALNKIEDPAKRAEAGAKIFGKGWAGMAELIDAGAPKLRSNLAAVSDAKIFDEKKVNDARKLREGFDSIGDAAGDLLLVIGSSLAPVIAELAPKLAKIVEAAAPVAEAIGAVLVRALEAVEPALDGVIVAVEGLVPVLELAVTAVEKLVTALETLTIKGGDNQVASDAIAEGYKDLIKQVKDAGLWTKDLDSKLQHATLTKEDLTSALATLSAGTGEFTADTHLAGEAARDSAAAVEELADKAAELTGSVHGAGEAARDSKQKIEDWKDRLDDAAVSAEAVGRKEDAFALSTQMATDEIDRQRESAEQAAEGLDKQRQSLEDLIDAQRAAADAQFAVNAAGRDYRTFLGDLNKKVEEAKGDQDALNAIYDEGVQTTAALADATVRAYTEQQAANGVTMTSAEKNALWTQTMLDAVATQDGPLAQSTLDYIARVNGIPESRATEFAAAVKAGDIETVNAILADAARERTATISVNSKLDLGAKWLMGGASTGGSVSNPNGPSSGGKVFTSGVTTSAGGQGLAAGGGTSRRPQSINLNLYVNDRAVQQLTIAQNRQARGAR